MGQASEVIKGTEYMFSEVRMELRENAIAVYSPWETKDVIKAIAGARWAKASHAWLMPVSAITALILVSKFPQAEIPPEIRALADSARGIKKAGGLKTKDVDELQQPQVRKTDAWLHQLRGFNFSMAILSPAEGEQVRLGHYHKGVLLAMDMGTGKSKTAIDLIQNLPEVRRVLILCPKSVVPVWPWEFSKHLLRPQDFDIMAPEKGTVAKKAEGIKKWQQTASLDRKLMVILNYEASWRPAMGDMLLKIPWDVVVLDESHKVKSPQGKVSKFCGKLGKVAKYKIALTGTPLPHSPLDAFGQYRFLDPGIYGTSFTAFRAKYAEMGGFGGHQVVGFREEEMDEFNRRFYSIAYRVLKEEALDLPEAQHVQKFCDMSKEATQMYKELSTEMFTAFEKGEISVDNALVKMLRLAQIACGHVKNDDGDLVELGNYKKNLLAETVESIGSEEAIIVFCRFQKDLDAVQEVAKEAKRKFFELSGRVKELQEFKDYKVKPGEGGPVIAVQIQAGGVGVDLTRARYCIYYSVGYSLGDYEQSLARCHRPGQTRNVVYVHLVTRGTVEPVIYQALQEKKDIVESVLGPRAKKKKLGSGYGEEIAR